MKGRVLIIDDDPIMGNMLESMLSDAGYTATYVDSGEEALKKIHAISPDIVISDIVMPNMNGHELHAKLRNTPETAGIPFVFLSAKTEASDQLEGLRMGADDYVCKPFDMKDLIKRMEKVMDRAAKARTFHSNADFSGNLSQMKLNDIIQIIEMNCKSGELLINDEAGHEIGKAMFREGQIADARKEPLEGEEAFFDLMEEEEGFFEFYGRQIIAEGRITCGNMSILLTGSRLIDESKNLDDFVADTDVFLQMDSGKLPKRVKERTDPETLAEIRSMIDKPLSVRNILNSGRMSRPRAASVLADLFDSGLLKIRETPPKPPKPPVSPATLSEINNHLANTLAQIRKKGFTGSLGIGNLKEKAAIYFQDGRVIHAVFGRASSLKAIFRILSDKNCTFIFRRESVLPESTIGMETDALLVRANAEALEFGRIPADFFTKTICARVGADMDAFGGIVALARPNADARRIIDALPMTDLQAYGLLMKAVENGAVTVFEGKEAPIQLITDSSADLSPDILENRNIMLAPISFTIGRKVYYDGINIVPEDFYQMMADSNVFPAPSAPSTGDFHSIFGEIAPDRNILAVFQSGKLDRLIDRAVDTAERNRDHYASLRENNADIGEFKMEIMDGGSISMGLGLLVLEASEGIEKGEPFDQIRDRIRRIIPTVRVLLMVDTLEYAYNRGWLEKKGKVQKKFHRIKPILEIRNGGVSIADRAGEGTDGQLRMIEALGRGLADKKCPIKAAVMHAGKPDWAGQMARLLKNHFDCADVVISKIGPTVGSCSGPNAVGIACFPIRK